MKRKGFEMSLLFSLTLPSPRGRGFFKQAGLALACATLAACAVGPDYVPPQAEAPKQWLQAPASAQAAAHLDEWWKGFNDPTLNRLIADAIRSNLDLKLAQSRIVEARTNWDGIFAAGLPTVNARSNVMRRRNNANLSTQGGGFGGNSIINIFQMGFDASWELDLFGGVRRALESADANVEAAEESRRDVLVSLLGEVARNYIELRANQQLLAVTQENLHSQEETLALMKLRQQAGLSSELEVAQTEALAADTRAQAPLYQTAAQQAIHALALLLGETPDKLAPRLERPGPIPQSADPAQAELPSELLRRRPDIRQAERKLAAANADIGVATAELYPRISLSAFLGLQNTDITTFTPIGKSWSMASALTMPILNWGKITANIHGKEAIHEQSLLGYQSTVLKAFKEVEDALVAERQTGQRIESLRQSVDAQQLALSLAAERYRKGLTAYLDVLSAERGLFQAQRELVDGQARQSQQRVALYKALGGGWQILADKEGTEKTGG